MLDIIIKHESFLAKRQKENGKGSVVEVTGWMVYTLYLIRVVANNKIGFCFNLVVITNTLPDLAALEHGNHTLPLPALWYLRPTEGVAPRIIAFGKLSREVIGTK